MSSYKIELPMAPSAAATPWEHELAGAAEALDIPGGAHPKNNRMLLGCPKCGTYHAPLDVDAESKRVSCPVCSWEASGKAGDVAKALKAMVPSIATSDSSEPIPPAAVELGSLKRAEPGDPGELIKNRFLCRGGGMLLVGPSGIGKSSFTMQLGMCLALGKTAFAIQPARPMRVLLIQAENDDGDLAEMRDGVLAGLNFTPEERRVALSMFLVHRCDDRSGAAFFDEVVAPLLELCRPDMLILDPAFSYMEGEVKSSTDVGIFCRKQLNPLIRRYDCGVIVVHHTNKPARGQEKPDWSGADFAYLGSGSAEWTNWARAVMTIRQIDDTVFELRAAKRGARIGWVEDDGQTRTTHRFIQHSKVPGAICWESVAADDAPEFDIRGKKKVKPPTPDELAQFLMERCAGECWGGTNDPNSFIRRVALQWSMTLKESEKACWAAHDVTLELGYVKRIGAKGKDQFVARLKEPKRG